MRDELARPTIAKLKVWLGAERERCRPSSYLFAACRYAINQWPTLLHYLDDGRIPIDNNQVENRMRPVAIGRKNWLFAGSDASGKRAAILLTVLASAKLAGHDRFAYLCSVITRISTGWPQSRLDELLPSNWVADAEPSRAPVAIAA
jgi:transposase